MARVSRELPQTAREFYKTAWLAEKRDEDDVRFARMSLFRFNLLKNLVATLDDRAAHEMFEAEMRSRLAVQMCYALFFSALITGIAWKITPTEDYVKPVLGWAAIDELVVLFLGLLPNLRLLRIAEVETVFTYCFANRTMLRQLIQSGK